MDFLKINFFFNLLIGCVGCWLFVAISRQIQVQVVIGEFGSSILIFVIFMPIWTSWLWLDPIIMFWFVLSLKSLIAAISQSPVSLALVAPNRGWGTPHLVPRVWLYVREGFLSFRQSKLECSCHESCVFCICSRINNAYVYAFFRNPDHHSSLMTVSFTLWLGCN